jgi:hypothetical protein
MDVLLILRVVGTWMINQAITSLISRCFSDFLQFVLQARYPFVIHSIEILATPYNYDQQNHQGNQDWIHEVGPI